MDQDQQASSKLIKQELDSVKYRSLQEIKNLRSLVQKHNNAEISLKKKVKGPDGYHLQCIHFKSKKCPYRIRFLQCRDKVGQHIDQYEMEDCVLEHKNHQDYNQLDKIIRNSKQKIEGHRELIVEIYLNLKKDSQKSSKPTVIQKMLLKEHKIDIYDGHKDKSIQEKLKKKLDNIIRDYKEGMKRQCKKGEQTVKNIQKSEFIIQDDEWENFLDMEPEKHVKLELQNGSQDSFFQQEFRL